MLASLGCTTEKESEPEPLVFCSSQTQSLYDPLGSDELLAFPDDFLRVEDPQSPTGYRLDLSVERAPWTSELAAYHYGLGTVLT